MRPGRLLNNTMPWTRGIASVAEELERRWNARLEEIQSVQQRLSTLDENRYSLTSEQEARIRFMGENFAGIWESNACPPALKR
jgi:hypothetical protein